MQQREVGSFEAKTHLSKLITEAMKGNDIIITKHGKRVVKLIAYDKSEPVNSIQEAIDNIKNLRKGVYLNPPGTKKKVTIKELIDEGRK